MGPNSAQVPLIMMIHEININITIHRPSFEKAPEVNLSGQSSVETQQWNARNVSLVQTSGFSYLTRLESSIQVQISSHLSGAQIKNGLDWLGLTRCRRRKWIWLSLLSFNLSYVLQVRETPVTIVALVVLPVPPAWKKPLARRNTKWVSWFPIVIVRVRPK